MTEGVAAGATPAFKPLRRSKLSEAIVEEILERLRRGDYAAGNALPSERVLADQFGVGRGSVREALRVLEYAGILEVRVGSGITFTERAHTKGSVMRAQAALAGDHSPLDIVAARLGVEPACARLAAEAASPSDIEALRATLEKQRELTVAGADPSEPDAMFHILLGKASHNDVMVGLVSQVVVLMQEGTWSDMKARSRQSPAGALGFLEHHQEIFDAIVAGDGDRAAEAMHRHLSAIEDKFLKA